MERPAVVLADHARAAEQYVRTPVCATCELGILPLEQEVRVKRKLWLSNASTSVDFPVSTCAITDIFIIFCFKLIP